MSFTTGKWGGGTLTKSGLSTHPKRIQSILWIPVTSGVSISSCRKKQLKEERLYFLSRFQVAVGHLGVATVAGAWHSCHITAVPQPGTERNA